ncbi:MAG: hypothetical protein LIP77_01695, partial [Planctomycetes bacterium]|nr:hypothetical protein [Planctomycetota bacterium]
GTCLAHRVYVFAYVDGDAIQVEGSFSRIQKVRHGAVVVTDGETGAVLLEGVTDDQGRFRFRPPADFLATGHGLHIRLDAGEGHVATWKMPAADLAALTPVATTTDHTDPVGPNIDPQALEALVGRVLDAKLAPLREALARVEDPEPGVREIVGGLGWIVGMLGLATYLKYRR